MADDDDHLEHGNLALMPKAAFRALLTKVRTARKDMDTARSSWAGLISDAVARHNLNKRAAKIIFDLDKLAPAERTETLYQLDGYVAHMGWDRDLFADDADPNRRKPHLVSDNQPGA